MRGITKREVSKVSKVCSWLCVAGMLFLTACGNSGAQEGTQADIGAQSSVEAQASAETGQRAETQAASAETQETDAAVPTQVRVGSLKGPTTMGIVQLMKKAEEGGTVDTYEFTMATAADEISAKLVAGDLDIALVPANLASVLYNKTQGQVQVIDINTLGVLYCVTTDGSIHSVEDLAGKTVITTGQGTTPEYALRTLLERSGVTDCTLEFKSEATEVAALLKDGTAQIGVLPQPFVTAALLQNDTLQTAFSLSEEWDRLDSASHLVTGVTVVRTAFLQERADAVERFVEEHASSAEQANADVDGTAQLVASYGIIEKAPVAAKAIPNCNLVCITGDEMKTALSGYLETLYAQNPQAVGGALPDEAFYVLWQ
ncbi:MAG: ABC transporter substrate-binding protein [Lachnospiraceae bacterium]|nr:ABC transporter substrate-binding protein [Lachnospiraceae bacterium]